MPDKYADWPGFRCMHCGEFIEYDWPLCSRCEVAVMEAEAEDEGRDEPEYAPEDG